MACTASKMVYNTFIMFFSLTVCFTVSVEGLDSTLVPNAQGPLVVRAVISKISTSNISFLPDDAVAPFMRLMAYVETRDGQELNANGGGIWNIDYDQFEEAQELEPGIIMELGQEHQMNHIGPINWSNLTYDHLSTPLYSGLVVRVLIHIEQRRSSSFTILRNIDYFSYWNAVFKESRALRIQWTMYAESITRTEDEGNYSQHTLYL